MTDRSEPVVFEPVRRAVEIEDPTNLYVVHAIANRLVAPFARAGITPNAVSLAGMACGVLAGFAYHDWPNTGFCVLGLSLMLGWHVMDGVDGQLARLTRTQSEFGKVVDGICDYTTFGAVYLGLALTLARAHGNWVWALVLAACLCHAVQSAVYEMQRETYLGWVRGTRVGAPDGAQVGAPVGAPVGRGGAGLAGPIADKLLLAYRGVQRVATGNDAAARRRLDAAIARDPAIASRIGPAYSAVFAPSLRRWSVMSANVHTLAIFVFAVAGRPILYFWYEIVGLSAVLALLLLGRRRLWERLLRTLEASR